VSPARRPSRQRDATGEEAPDTPAASAAAEAAGPVPSWGVWSLRVIVLLGAVLVFLQPVFAGLFVTGDVGMLRMHSTTAGFITAAAFLQFVAAILLWRPGRGPAWPIWASLAFFLASEVQGGLGYARAVGAHIPLGVSLFGFAVGMVIATWSSRLRVRRSEPRRRAAGT
jgi:hypothetical protein